MKKDGIYFLKKAFVCMFLLLVGMPATVWGVPASQNDGNEDAEYVDYYKLPFTSEDQHLARSRINYKPVAQSLTVGCENDYQKIKAIYLWMCATIDYDTSFRIHSADSCFRAKKGVCQAYCELFYRLATAAGIRVEIVRGKAKGYTNADLDNGHGWIFAYTRKDHGILLDPAWGAGGVNGKTFIRRNNPLIWFNVMPERLIMSHFPEEESYQLIETPVTPSEFMAMPYPHELWAEYGLDARELLERARGGGLSMPEFFNGGEGLFRIIDFPPGKSLRIGQVYTFRVKMNTNSDFAIMNKEVICSKGEWTDEGDGVYSIQFMPRDVETLSFNIRNPSRNAWSTMVRYAIESPTEEDWQNVEQAYPLSLPEARAVLGLDAKGWELFGVDGQTLLGLIRESGTQELPVTHTERGQRIRIVSVPMTRKLKVGTTYDISFYPESRGSWALINNSSWFENWTVADDGMYSISFTPASAGSLSLFLKADGSDSYLQCLEYEVTE